MILQVPQQVIFTRELRIGSFDEPNYALTSVGAISVSSNGDIFASQPQDKVIRVFDSRGKFVRKIGGNGGGPGEFRSIDGFGWSADSLWVTDIVQQRVTFFSRQGRLLTAKRITGPLLKISARPTPVKAVLSDGSLIGLPATGQQRDIEDLQLVRFDQSGRTSRTLATLDIRGSMGVILTGHSVINFFYPVRTDDLWAVSPNGESIVIAKRKTQGTGRPIFRITRILASGDTAFERAFSFKPVALPNTARDSMVKGASDLFMHGRISRAQADRYASDSLKIPRIQPPVSQVFVTGDGAVWIGRENIGLRSVNWMVLKPNGEVQGAGILPVNFRGLYANRTHLYGVATDHWGVSYIVRYKVSWK